MRFVEIFTLGSSNQVHDVAKHDCFGGERYGAQVNGLTGAGERQLNC